MSQTLVNLQTPQICSLLPPSPPLHKLHHPQIFTLNPTISRKISALSLLPRSLQFSRQNGLLKDEDDDDEESVIGDCLVFEEGIFEDPFLQQEQESFKGNSTSNNHPRRRRKTEIEEVEPENLIPDKWIEMQREINITKKEKRKLAKELEFGSKVEKRREELRPIGSGNGIVRNVDFERYLKLRDEKLNQLKPLFLDNPEFNEDEEMEVKGNGEGSSNVNNSSSRVPPRNPRLAVYGVGLDDVTEFFNSGNYDPNAEKTSQGRRKLFTKEEKVLLNRRIPDLAAATSGKWQPLHTLAASGDFYLMTSLLKYSVDINASDKDGLTAIHKAILGNKQAIFNCLLRESANPFTRDKDGATLMHYAVRRASSQMIKILLLYNIDINIPDNDGWTPLHLVVQSRRTDIVRLLLIKGADKTLKNRDGLTPLELCLYSGRDTRTYELIKLLKQLPKSR